ncbi:ABC transporter permease [Eupransor demetentiae]|uniref:Permease component (SalY) n=1 Tax=Eupransor demetentiae TaxID=3109584 RepID=A0ABP0EQE1_9LACO|nr:ABC-type antimicrobial peptide transport system [Lactobacillaceae bacterium LMG 33000]
MKYLLKKLVRTVTKNWTQFFSVFLMAMLSVLFYTALEGVWNGLHVNISNYAQRSNLADSELVTTGLSNQQIEEIANVKGVKNLSARTKVNGNLLLDGKQKNIEINTFGNQKVSKVLETNGNLPSSKLGYIYLNDKFIQENNLKKGDKIDVSVNGRNATLKIAGEIESPDRMYYTGTSDYIAPESENYGYVFTDSQTLLKYFAIPDINNVVDFTIKEGGYSKKQIRNIVQSKYITIQNRDSNVGVSTAFDRVNQIRNLSILFSVIFILLAILAMYTTIKKVVNQQQNDIATLTSLGMKQSSIAFYYSLYGLLVGISGASLGLVLSPLLAKFIMNTQQQMFSLPSWNISFTPISLLVALFVVLICTSSAYFATNKTKRSTPATLFKSGNSEKMNQHVLLEKFHSLWLRIPYGNKWSIRDNFGNKIQMSMGLLGIIGGLALIMTGFGTKDSMQNQVNTTYGREYTYSNKINLDSVVSEQKVTDLVRYLNAGTIETVYGQIDKHNFEKPIVIFDDNSQKYLKMRMSNNKTISGNGVYISEGIAKEFKLEKGQKITISPSLANNSEKFVISGILKTNSPQSIYISKTVWQKHGFKYKATSILTRKSKETINQKFDGDHLKIVNIGQQRKNANEMITNLNSIFQLIQIFGILLTIVILYNIGSLSFAERTRSYATLEILGFSVRNIRKLTIEENLTITIIGWIIGVPFGYWFLSKYITTFNSAEVIYYPSISIISFILSSIIVVLASTSTIFMFGKRLRNLDMIAATKGIE